MREEDFVVVPGNVPEEGRPVGRRWDLGEKRRGKEGVSGIYQGDEEGLQGGVFVQVVRVAVGKFVPVRVAPLSHGLEELF